MEAAIEAGADDVQSDDDGHTIYCGFGAVGDVSKALEAALGEPESVKVIWKPKNSVPVDEERAQSLMKLVGTLEDDDDVQNVYANFEVDEATLEKLSAA
jgi:transcriptional/translational regulatory protein YebC/TACO1